MKFSTFSAVAIPAFFAYVAYRYYETNYTNAISTDCIRGVDGRFNPNTPGDCYFSESYQDARNNFVNLARAAKAELYEFKVLGDLTTNVAVLRGLNSDRSIMHISAVHGQEGYAGSAVQCAALNYFAHSLTRPNVTMVFVHAANPYGFHVDRRVNEDNIDLNRNFLTPEEFQMAINRDPNFAGYVDVDHLLNPPRKLADNWVLNDLVQYKDLAFGVAKFGMSKVKKAMVSGNYWKSKGLGYGGVKQAISTQNVIEIFQSEALGMRTATTDGVIVIDVHTGLGPEGVDTLMVSDSVNLQQLEAIFPTEYAGSNDIMKKKGRVVGGIKEHPGGSAQAASSGYEETIGTTAALCSTYKNPNIDASSQLCLTQEFGTRPSVLVGKALVQENQAFSGDDRK